jgi:chemotaxis protein CheD
LLSRLQGLPPQKANKKFQVDTDSDKSAHQHWVNLLPGDLYVTKKNEVIHTVLGSCVSVCIRDPINHVAGMNHFLLAEKKGAQSRSVNPLDSSDAARYGNWAMELLINEMLKNGANKKYFEIKVFGGGNVIRGMTKFNVGETNVNFILDFLKVEGFRVASKDVGSEFPRKIIFETGTGKVEVQKLHGKSKQVFEAEKRIAPTLNTDKQDPNDGIEFF